MATTPLQRNLLRLFLLRNKWHPFAKPPLGSAALAAHNGEYHRLSRTFCGQETDVSGGTRCAKLVGRGLIRLSGRDAADLLQGLVTSDTEVMSVGNGAMYAMFLNKEGRILFDVMCYSVGNGTSTGDRDSGYLLECDLGVKEKLAKHLKMYRLRKKADVSSADDQLRPWAVFDPNATHQTAAPALAGNGEGSGHVTDVADPRVVGLGRRVILPKDEPFTDRIPEVTEVSAGEYTLHRYRWGVPEGVIDLPPGEALPLESNLAFMNGVSFSKGCYLGQELTARTHHTGVTRKRIMPIEILSHGTAKLEPACKIVTEEGKNVGKLRSYHGNRGLALLRTAQCKNKKLFILNEDGGRSELSSQEPAWWPLQEQ